MKIAILTAALLASLTANAGATQQATGTKPEAPAPIFYAVGADVVEVDTAAERVTIEDARRELWDFYGTGYAAGDRLIAFFSDNGTPGTLLDDELILAWGI